MHSQPNNPLHGVTLATMVEYLVAKLGWEERDGMASFALWLRD